MYGLSVCADTVFLDLPFEERVKKIADAGFMVEFWGWKGRNLDVLADLEISTFSATQSGSLVHPDYAETYVAGVKESSGIAQKLQSPCMVIHGGELGPNGEVTHQISASPITHWITAYKSLCKIAELGKQNQIVYCLEVLNTKVDHAGYSINLIENAVRLVKEVDSPYIKILFDIYHTQVEEGNVVELLQKYHPYIGHIHVADVPGRHEPGTGELNYPFIANVLREVGYQGAVGMERGALVFDTGHWRFGGGHSICGIHQHAERIWHVHFKDHDPAIARLSREHEWDGPQSVGHGIFPELGQGDVDFPGVLEVLKAINYDGWIVVEQDVLPGMGSPKESAQRNRAYLRSIGL